MIDTKKIIEAAERKLQGTDMFVVGCTCTPGNEIELLIDSDTSVAIEACAELSRAVEAEFDRDEEDFSLTVASAGIGSELKSLRQYRKLIGGTVEVLLNSGIKMLAKLDAADDEGITISYEEKQADRREAPAGDIMDHIAAFFDARIAALTGAGIKRNRLVLDPGVGFFLGAAPETSLSVLARFDELRLRFDLPVLLSVSRKSFLRALTGRGPGDVGAATLAAELTAAAGGADFIRTHEPRPLRDGLAVLAALKETARIR